MKSYSSISFRMQCYLLMLILSTALAGVIDDNSFSTQDQGRSTHKYVVPYEALTLPEVQTYVKELEKEAEQAPESNDEDYLNDLDDDIGYEVEEGIEEAVGIADRISYNLLPPSREPYTASSTEAPYPVTGYQPDAGYNEFVDGLILNMVDDIVKGNMDPIFFRMRNRTHIAHDNTKDSAPEGSMNNGEKKRGAKAKEWEKNSLGGGFLTGLQDIVRVGDASVRGKTIKQIESNITIGPVMLELNVRRTPASIRRQKAKGRKVKYTRQIRVSSDVLNGSIIAELNSEQTKLIHFSLSPPDPEKTRVTTKRDKTVNNRLTSIGKDIMQTVFHEGSFIMKRIRQAAERSVEKQTVDL